MTLNIAHGRGLSLYQGFHSLRGIHNNLLKIARLIKEAGPDVVALQEVDESSHWNKHLHLLEHLAENTGFPHHYVGVHNRRLGVKPLAYGNAFLSKYPIVHPETVPFGNKTLGEKGFTFVFVEVAGHQLPLLNVHLDYQSRKIRQDQVQRVADFIKQRLKDPPDDFLPPLICGDFNSTRRSTQDAVHRLFQILQDYGHYQLFPENASTWPTYFPTRGLDFVFIPPGWKIGACEVLPAFVSDHRPVVIEFEPLFPSPTEDPSLPEMPAE